MPHAESQDARVETGERPIEADTDSEQNGSHTIPGFDGPEACSPTDFIMLRPVQIFLTPDRNKEPERPLRSSSEWPPCAASSVVLRRSITI